MSLKETLQNDWKTALKDRNKLKASVLSMARAAVLLYEKSGASKEATDDVVLDIIVKEIKQRRESIEEFKKGNRDDLIKETQDEVEILLNYLPQQLTEIEIKDLIARIASEVGANNIKDMGKLMGAIVPATKGKADGKLVSTLVKEYLNK